MKISLSPNKLLFIIISTYQFIYTFLSFFSDSLSNKYAAFIFILAYICFNLRLSRTKIIYILISNIIIIFTIAYHAYWFGIDQIFHSDFYSIIGLYILMLLFIKRDFRKKFLKFFLNNSRLYLYSCFFFLFVVIASVIWKNGLRTDFGTTVPILYGPFEAAHILGYICISIYCGLHLLQSQTGPHSNYVTRIYILLKLICSGMVIWTSARSAVLALLIIVFADFISLRSWTKRVFILFSSIFLFLLLTISTNILSNIPIVQKTVNAMLSGSITNGRERFNRVLLYYYEYSLNTWQKIFGIGMNNLRHFMKNSIGAPIHAHNDYINALVGYGLLGLVLYLAMQIKLYLSISNKFYSLLLQLFIFVLAYFNGLAMYIAFTPLLIIVIVYFDELNFELKP